MNHLIDRLQNFTLDRKILSVDSNDRDINRWPNPAEFEISTPQNYTNIESIRLVNIQSSNKFYNISEYLQNNKLIINFNNSSTNTIITLEDGLYNTSNLERSLENLLNNGIIDPGNGFKVKYNEVNRKMYFGSTTGIFKLIFNDSKDLSYNNNCNNYLQNYINVYSQYNKWGLGALLGFKKDSYESKQYPNKNIFHHDPTNPWISNDTNILIPPSTLDLEENKQIYIEVSKLNQSDEIKPYITDRVNNTNSGIVNSFFAKTPIIICEQNQSINNKECYIEGISYYQPPLDKISKLKIKLRYHNGMLLDLQNNNINMTFEINQIRNEMKDYNVRTPFYH